MQCEINSKYFCCYTYLQAICTYSSLSLDTHISIGGLVIEQFEGPVGGLINDSLELAARE